VARGYLAATFDYRGIGESAPATLRGFQVDIRDWATQDCPAVVEFIKARTPGVPSRQAAAQGRRSAAWSHGAVAALAPQPRVRRRRRRRERAALLCVGAHGLHANAPIEYRRIAPRDLGVQRIGHFGFFRPQWLAAR
jgi:predicted alpha/beta hydrolase